MQEKYGNKGKKLYFAFVDLEKHLIEYLERSLDGLLRKAGVEEWLMNAVMAVYEGAQNNKRRLQSI